MRKLNLVFVVGSMSLLGCGDDDAVPPDARADATSVDSPADGPTFKGYDGNEGGEIRSEYILFPNGRIGARTTAFFWKDPGSTKYFEYIDQMGCNDVTGKTKWPTAMNPIGERVYYDVGPYLVLTGGPNPYTIPKFATMTADPVGRTHPANAWYFEPATGGETDPATAGNLFLTEKTLYDVTLPGSTEFPGAFFEDAMYMPASFTLTSPNHAGPHAFPLAAPQTFTWSTPTETPPAGTEVLSLVAFTGPNGPAVLCVEPADGSITVPANMMDVALNTYPTGGTIARQNLTHTVREMTDANGPTGKRIDIIGVWCFAGTGYSRL